MPRIIRQALAERLLTSPRAADFLRDFSEAMGIPLRFATSLGVELPLAGTRPPPAICRWMREDAIRERLCARTIQEGALQPAASPGRETPCGGICAAGLREAAVPLKLGGEIFGYLLVGQVAARPLDRPGLNRWRHALERVGQRVSHEELEALAASVGVVEDERFAAILRLLEWSAEHFTGLMEAEMTPPLERLSPPVRKACAFMRAHFEEPLSLGRIAAEVGMSREHFCTIFHQGTGLRFIEYLTRLRIERASGLLATTERSVTDIALSCGFQSISHFNRRFRAITGEAPTAYRQQVGGRSGGLMAAERSHGW